MKTRSVRVLVVDDSAFMRQMICDLLQRDEQIQVVATARNGEEALEMVQRHHPDVITLDIEMPLMDGLTVLPQIIRYKTPVIMLSSFSKEGAEQTIRALELGAFDFITKPVGGKEQDFSKIAAELIAKVKLASHFTGLMPLRPSVRQTMLPKRASAEREAEKMVSEIIAIGTSTGGPRALQTLLPQLPASLHASVVVVQHMPPGFTRSLAKRLNEMCQVQVMEAVDGQILQNGHVYIAPGDYHMRILSAPYGRYQISLQQDPPVGGHRPSVDVLFHSLASLPQRPSLQAVLLTGMGKDGAEGLAAIKAIGGLTIAESEETCVVFGMPKAAIALGCVDWVLPLGQIAERLLEPHSRRG